MLDHLRRLGLDGLGNVRESWLALGAVAVVATAIGGCQPEEVGSIEADPSDFGPNLLAPAGQENLDPSQAETDMGQSIKAGLGQDSEDQSVSQTP